MRQLFGKRFWVLGATLILAGCSTSTQRGWIDEQTAVSVIAQGATLVLARESFTAGVNVRDYAELGLLEINRSGSRQPYLAIVCWSTINRTPDEMRQQAERLRQVTLWLDDQPLLLTSSEAALSTPAFALPSPTARELYYALTRDQLVALAAAQQLHLRPADSVPGEQAYVLWRGTTKTLNKFAERLIP